jgi:GxxExxY protein
MRKGPQPTSASALNELSRQILDAAFVVHDALGPGLLESAYEACLEHVLTTAGVRVQRQVSLPVRFQEVFIDAGYRIDLRVGGTVIVEVKAVQKVAPIHKAQLLTYLKLSDLHLGLLLNFNVERMKFGIIRLVHRFPDP